MIREVIELEIPVNLASEEAIELVEQLEEKLKELKEAQEAQIRGSLKDGSVKLGKYLYKEVDVYRKVLSDDVDKMFTKVEVKPNTATIKEYQKLHRKLPEGVQEVYWYSRLGRTDLEKQEEARKKREALRDSRKSDIENPLKGIKFKKIER